MNKDVVNHEKNKKEEKAKTMFARVQTKERIPEKKKRRRMKQTGINKRKRKN